MELIAYLIGFCFGMFAGVLGTAIMLYGMRGKDYDE